MSDSQKMREWLRGQGYEVNMRGALPNRQKEAYYAAHPSERPDGSVAPLTAGEFDDGPAEDMGLIEPDSDAEPGPAPQAWERPRTFRAVPDGPAEPLPDDKPAAHASRESRKASRASAQGPKPGRVSGVLRKDIDAKIRFALMIPGSVWQARDQLCGAVFMGQVPEIADAFTDIVCDSADLLAFFTGPAGGFMKILKLGAALMPVAQVAMAHHVYHTVGAEPAADYQQPDYADYAA